jgi:hypothetical protein
MEEDVKQVTPSMWASFPQASAVKTPPKPSAGALCRRVFAPILVAAFLIGGYEAHLALQSPGKVIRHDLTRAGSEVARLPWSTLRAHVQQSVSRHFSGYGTTVDPAGFPTFVKVTLHDLDPEVCRDAYRMAERIEGEVVIEIEGRGDMTCHDRKAITWRIMP